MKTIKIFGLPVLQYGEADTRGLNPENPSVSLAEWMSSQDSDGGEVVNLNSSMRYSAVYACVRIISETIASLPINILENRNGRVENNPHPLKYFIEQNPNESMTRFQFWETIISHMLLNGNGYAIIKRNRLEQPEKFLLITNPQDVEVVFNSEKDVLKYKVTNNGTTKTYSSYEILHLAGLSLDGVEGLSPIEYHRKTISTGLGEVNFQRSFINKGAQLSGVLEFPKALTDNAIKRLTKSWQDKHGGSENVGKTAILEEGGTYKTIGIKPIDAQFMEQRRFTLEDIARIYRVPLHLLQDLSRSTNNNIEHQSIDFVQHTIRPQVKRIESELDRKIFTEAEKKERRYFTRFNLEALLRGDVKSRADFYKSLYYTGSMNANEIRSLEGMNPYDGGDQYFVQSNTQPVNQLGNGN